MCASLIFSIATNAQISLSDFSVGVAGNYTMYKGDFGKATPGVKVEVNYGLYEKLGFTLGFTKGFAIKHPSSIQVRNSTGETKNIDSDIRFKFSTISIATQYRIIGNEETAFGAYIPFGAAFVIAKYDEKARTDIPSGYTALDEMEPGSENGFTLNLGVGARYSIGNPVIFGEAGISVPANQVNNAAVVNPIPAHFTFNVGVRLPLGSRE